MWAESVQPSLFRLMRGNDGEMRRYGSLMSERMFFSCVSVLLWFLNGPPLCGAAKDALDVDPLTQRVTSGAGWMRERA